MRIPENKAVASRKCGFQLHPTLELYTIIYFLTIAEIKSTTPNLFIGSYITIKTEILNIQI